MSRKSLAIVAAVVAGAAAVAAVAQAGELSGHPSPAGAALTAPGALQGEFASAAREFHVPLSVLLSVSYQETRWDTHGGRPSATGNYNVMGLTQVDQDQLEQPTGAEKRAELNLRGDGSGTGARRHAFHPSKRVLADVDAVQSGAPALHTLDAAAALIGAPASQLRSDPKQSIRGGAALLAHYEKAATGSLPADPAQWYAAVARYSQSPDAQGAEQFAGRVYANIRHGNARWTDTGQQVSLRPDSGAAVPAATVKHVAATYAPTAAQGTVTDDASTAPLDTDSPSATPSDTATDDPSATASATASATPTDTTSASATPTDTPSASATPTATSTATPAGPTQAATPAPECPTGLACDFVPAAHKLTDPSDPTSYGNYDIANRPADGDAIKYIVIHDTESTYSTALNEFQDPTAFASANYLIRSSDGLVTQMVPNQDIAWHAGNKYMNMHAIGIEHEGYAIQGASWYTTSEYESSAELVKYLAAKYGIPLDRQHIIGHDDVPGPLDDAPGEAYVSGMHWDPGTFWDWNYYLSLLGVPVTGYAAGSPLVKGEHVRLAIPFSSSYEPKTTECPSCDPIPAQPANFVYLHTSPGGPLLSDPYIHPSGSAGTTAVSDWSDKLVTGEDFVVAGVSGDWTQIWYAGKAVWFYNPRGSYTQPVTGGLMKIITPESGASSIPVYGRAYPDASAYPSSVTVQPVTPLTKYSIPAGQSYVTSGVAETGDFYNTININGDGGPGDRVLVTGTTQYYPIRYNHRLAYVRTSDVQFVASTSAKPATARADLIGRDGTGALWQYQGTGSASAPFLTKYRVATGWQSYKSATPLTPLRPNGTGDVIARDSSGTLWYYKGSGHAYAPSAARVKAGTGWGGYTMIAAPGDVTGDGKPDVFAMDSSRTLWLYAGTGSTTAPFAARVKIGTGYGPYNVMTGVGDVTGDGKGDFVARDASGRLYLYAGTGNAAKPLAGRVPIGSGFQVYNQLAGPGDITGDGKPDLVARDSSGTLWLYPGTGNAAAPFGARVEIGTGWSGYNILF